MNLIEGVIRVVSRVASTKYLLRYSIAAADNLPRVLEVQQLPSWFLNWSMPREKSLKLATLARLLHFPSKNGTQHYTLNNVLVYILIYIFVTWYTWFAIAYILYYYYRVLDISLCLYLGPAQWRLLVTCLAKTTKLQTQKDIEYLIKMDK